VALQKPACVLALLAAPALASAQEAPPPAEPAPSTAPVVAPAPALDAATAARIEDIDQRSRIAERKLELLDEEAEKRKVEGPVTTAGDRGFNFRSADGAFLVKVRGLVHADAREYLDVTDRLPEPAPGGPFDTFLIRRARPTLEATLANVVDFKLMPDFGGGQALVQDAYVDVRPVPWLKLRGGKFKPPVGLERLQSASALHLPERGFTTSLVPNRDVGFQLRGALFAGAVTYELGVWNGGPDNVANFDADNNQAKDYAARVFLQPWKGDPYALLANLGVGLAATTGKQRFTPATGTGTPTPQLPSFRSPGQQSVFQYAGGALARGRRTRLVPQGFFYYGSFGLLGEYARNEQRVVRNADAAELAHSAWFVAGTWVLGGKAAFEGATVTSPFDLRKGTLGALELAARFSRLDLDEDTFGAAGFADPLRAVAGARAFGAAANWHWSRTLKLVVAFERTWFDGGSGGTATGVADRKAETVLFQRIQAAF
jgi:phosphate-selective porin OprO and OprP